jgi:hypothetical protein
MLGRLGCVVVLGCDAVNQAEEKEVRRQTSSCWAAKRNGHNRKKKRGREEKGFPNLKRNQTNEIQI